MTSQKKSQFSGIHGVRQLLLISLLGVLALVITLGAQTKPPATFADYGQWENLVSAGSYGGLSPDGKWLSYAVNRSNGNNELRIIKLADSTETTAAFGVRPAFSSDSKWIAYLIGQSEAEQEKLRKKKKPVQNKLGLLNLSTGETSTFDGIEYFAFSSDGAFLVMQRYRPSAPAAPLGRIGRGGSDESEEKLGTTLIVRQLAGGIDTTFGNVSQFAWQDTEHSRLLAMTISAEGKTGNGVHLFDPETAVLRVLDSSSSIYTGLAWRKDAADLAVFRAKAYKQREGSTHLLLAWTGLGKSERRFSYDPFADPSFPDDMRTVTFRPLAWSDDGRVLFLGIAMWDDKIIPAEKEDKDAEAPADEEPSTVEIWHWTDVFVMPWQKAHARQDRRLESGAAYSRRSRACPSSFGQTR